MIKTSLEREKTNEDLAQLIETTGQDERAERQHTDTGHHYSQSRELVEANPV